MDAIKEFLAGVNWENVKTLIVEYVNGLDIEGLFNDFVSFVKDLIVAITGGTAE